MAQVDSFFTIQYWMVSELKLKGLERDIYAIIFGFCQNEEFHKISLDYFADWTNTTIRGCKKAINSLRKQDLIQVHNYPGKHSYYNINPEAVKEAITRAIRKKELIRKPEKEKNNALVTDTIEKAKTTVLNENINNSAKQNGFESREELREFLLNTDWTYHGKK